MRELLYRQRNIVFPETAMNGGRYWRNLACRKYPFTTGQKIGFAFILFITLPGMTAILIFSIMRLLANPEALETWANLPLAGMALVSGAVLVKASIAVFGKPGAIPELSPAARRGLVSMSRRKA
jgi:hypothetical protein